MGIFWLSLRRQAVLATAALMLLGGGTMLAFIAPRVNSQETREPGRPNRLAREKSPYLLQHAHNPVDWYPWGEEAFERSRKENKLIFLSIGYSTCYWCHVMEREVFENVEIARSMNETLICIKVDREERPDVDRVYMSALQAMTGGGGWPMSMFLTPDLKPFYGATYIPPEPFKQLLGKVAEAWAEEPDRINQAGQRLTAFLKGRMDLGSGAGQPGESALVKGFEQFSGLYDATNGGFGPGPKFPRPATFNFLLRYHIRFREPRALEMTLETLEKMAEGGMYDHLGGGFHRYSVDGQWRVPHFEKMLYDQAQLVNSYLDAYQLTREESFARVARETLDYVLRRMTDEKGGFYSAEDAESAPDPARPKNKEEGAFYVWTSEDVTKALGAKPAELFKYAYGLREEGNALEDPHKVFVNKNILYLARSLDETAEKFDTSRDETSRLLAEARRKLLAEREKRPRPHLDDKILVSWNGLMISAFARAYQILEEPIYLRAAERSAEFIVANLYDSKTRRLLRRYRAGEPRFDALAQDYAFLVMGMLDLYEAGLDIRWLESAVELTERQNELFYDRSAAGFFDTSGADRNLLLRTKDDFDSAEPAANSVAVLNLLRLSEITDNDGWKRMAKATLAAFGRRLGEIPQTLPQMLAALDFHMDKPLQIIIAGNSLRDDTRMLMRQVHKRYIPNKIILLADGGAGQRFLSRRIPFIESVRMLEGKATAYVCENYACKLPTVDPAVMARQIDEAMK